MKIMSIFHLLSLIIMFLSSVLYTEGIADPVQVEYNRSKSESIMFGGPMVPDDVTVEQLFKRSSVDYRQYSCLRGAKHTGDSVNHLITNFGTDWYPRLRNGSNFLSNSTFWVNEFFHLGHVMYDIVMIQILQTAKIDRIVFQRPICYGNLCGGVGIMDSFYKGYLTALLLAGNQLHIPVYVRYHYRTNEVTPIYLSPTTKDYLLDSKDYPDPIIRKSINLESIMCFEKVYRSTSTNFGKTPVISPKAVKAFKSAAYSIVRTTPPLKSYFDPSERFVILFSYRGNKVGRHISNLDIVIERLSKRY